MPTTIKTREQFNAWFEQLCANRDYTVTGPSATELAAQSEQDTERDAHSAVHAATDLSVYWQRRAAALSAELSQTRAILAEAYLLIDELQAQVESARNRQPIWW